MDPLKGGFVPDSRIPWKALLQAAVDDPAVTRLELKGAKITDEDAALIADAIPRCRGLIELYLSENAIGDEGAAAIAAVLH